MVDASSFRRAFPQPSVGRCSESACSSLGSRNQTSRIPASQNPTSVCAALGWHARGDHRRFSDPARGARVQRPCPLDTGFRERVIGSRSRSGSGSAPVSRRLGAGAEAGRTRCIRIDSSCQGLPSARQRRRSEPEPVGAECRLFRRPTKARTRGPSGSSAPGSASCGARRRRPASAAGDGGIRYRPHSRVGTRRRDAAPTRAPRPTCRSAAASSTPSPGAGPPWCGKLPQPASDRATGERMRRPRRFAASGHQHRGGTRRMLLALRRRPTRLPLRQCTTRPGC